jgi:hypothetical protein
VPPGRQTAPESQEPEQEQEPRIMAPYGRGASGGAERIQVFPAANASGYAVEYLTHRVRHPMAQAIRRQIRVTPTRVAFPADS